MTAGAWLVVASLLPVEAPPAEALLRAEWAAFPDRELAVEVRGVPVTYHGHEDWRWATWVELSPVGDPLPVPRLVLDPEVLGGEIVLDDLPLDLAEYVLSAWLEAALSSPAGRLRIADRAAELASSEASLAAWPIEAVGSGLRAGLAEFGAHLLSLGLETRRAAARARGRGLDPCPLAREERLLYGTWRKTFDRPDFRLRSGDRPAGPAVPLADRRWLETEVLERDWTRDVVADLELGCRP